MIFDTNYSGSVDLSSVKESPYELGITGALMHIYENECNWNAIMKSVGISELRYYKETGEDLFVNEAGAFGGFVDKIKAFLKKVIEKIKAIFKKFCATFNQFTMSDKDFVKKYGTELIRKNLTDFEFEGYDFKNLKSFSDAVITGSTEFSTLAASYSDATATSNSRSDTTFRATKLYGQTITIADLSDSDLKEKLDNHIRGKISGANEKLDDADLREYIQEQCYGDSKETLENINMRSILNNITETSKDIKDVEKVQKNIIKNIENGIKTLDKVSMNITKYHGTSPKDGKSEERVDQEIKFTNLISDLLKTASNTATLCFGGIVQAVKDRNRQSKAICVKALSYKHESAFVSESYSDDIFAGVHII